MSHGREIKAERSNNKAAGGFSDQQPPPRPPTPVFVVTKKALSPETLIAFIGNSAVLEQQRHESRQVGQQQQQQQQQSPEQWPPLCPDILPGNIRPGNIRGDIRASSSSGSWSSCWVGKRSNLNLFRLGGADDWPSLDGGGSGKGISGGDLNLLGGNGCCTSTSCSAWPSFCEDDADIRSTKGPTEQELHSVENGRCKGWMRLPPIVMPESQQQQHNLKRSRSEAEEFQGLLEGKGEDGGAGSSSPTAEEEADLPPVNYLMLNKDFVVISHLRENLLLTLALTAKRGPRPESESESEVDGKRLRRHVFVGRFEAFSSYVRFGLGRDALRVATEANAGGTSTISESLSVEYFVRKFQAKDVVTEMEVEYCAMNWKKVDYICSLYNQRVGVSVTRAMSYPNPEEFTPQMAYRLLYKKLFGLVVARHGVTERHSFSQCILHVWCETTTTAKLLEAQYKGVLEELDITDDVIMVLTVAEGGHARPIFYESCLDRNQLNSA